MAISGIYQMDDDGIINVDTINLVPGTVIPKAPGSGGLQPVAAAGSFDVANLVLNDMRLNINVLCITTCWAIPIVPPQPLLRLQKEWRIYLVALARPSGVCKQS